VDSLAQLVAHAAEAYGDRIAFRLEAAAPEAWSYRRMARAVEAIASELRGPCAIPRGERVLVWGTASSPRLTSAYLGCIRAGLVLVPVDPRSADGHVHYGTLLWKAAIGGQVNSGPMSYSVNNRQYIAVAAGTALFSFALRQ